MEHDKRIKFLSELQELDISFEKCIELFIEFHFNELEKNSRYYKGFDPRGYVSMFKRKWITT